MIVTLEPRPNVAKQHPGTREASVKWVEEPRRCSHISAMCAACEPVWRRFFYIFKGA